MQGIGRALSEEILIDRDTGQVRNASLATYLMPLAIDVPEIETVLVEVPSEDGPFGLRAVAEPPGFGPPAAIANAIYDAVGVRITHVAPQPRAGAGSHAGPRARGLRSGCCGPPGRRSVALNSRTFSALLSGVQAKADPATEENCCGVFCFPGIRAATL